MNLIALFFIMARRRVVVCINSEVRSSVKLQHKRLLVLAYISLLASPANAAPSNG